MRRHVTQKELREAGRASRARSEAVARLVAATSDAYSFDRYAVWSACCSMLLRRGYSEREAEANPALQVDAMGGRRL